MQTLVSRTVPRDVVSLSDFVMDNVLTARNGSYFKGPTAGCASFVTGRFMLKPGMEPHPMHEHVEEELLIIMSGTGEITCDGKVTKVGPGDVMYTAPHVWHGVKNTGQAEMEFLYVKWTGRGEG